MGERGDGCLDLAESTHTLALTVLFLARRAKDAILVRQMEELVEVYLGNIP